jgi:hypothetical protein
MTFFGEIVRRLCESVAIARAVRRGSERVEGIEVYGREEFRRAVIGALLLLRDRQLPAWETLTQHVGSILEGGATDGMFNAHPAFMTVSVPDWSRGPEYLAACIAHMACIGQLYRSYEAEFPGRRVPRDVFTSSAAKERCDRAFYECLSALGKGAKG